MTWIFSRLVVSLPYVLTWYPNSFLKINPLFIQILQQMNKKNHVRYLLIAFILLFSSWQAGAQLFEVDASKIETNNEKQHSAKLPRGPLDDPANFDKFLEQFDRGGDKIVGGEDVDIEDYPWQVSLHWQGTQHFCGGTIVDREWVITASHCLYFSDQDYYLQPGDFRVRAGFSSLESQEGSLYTIAEIIMHPGYDDDNLQNDIALLRLSTPLNLEHPGKASVGIVRQADADEGMTDPGVMGKASGWGALDTDGPSPDILQAIEAPIRDIADTSYPPGWISGNMIMAGTDSTGVCFGDSGGPLVVPDGNGWYNLAGVSSWVGGGGCAVPGYPGVFARVSYFEDWIGEYMVVSDPNQYTTIWHEGFEPANEDGTLPDGWEVKRNTEEDGGLNGNNLQEVTDNIPQRWFRLSDETYPYTEGSASNFIRSGEAAMHISWNTPDFTWAISPEIEIPDDIPNMDLSFWPWIGNNINNNWITRFYLTILSDQEWETLIEWTDGTDNYFANSLDHPLDDYAGQTVRFGFVHEYNDGFQLSVDDIVIRYENEQVTATWMVDDGTHPLEGASVDIQGVGVFSTDAEGLAEVPAYLGPHDYQFTVSKDGYYPYEGTVHITEEGQVVAVSLEKIPFPEIEIDTEEIHFTVMQTFTDSMHVNIANPGDAPLEYALFVYPAAEGKGNKTPAHETASYNGYGLPPGMEINAAFSHKHGKTNVDKTGKDAKHKFDETVEVRHDTGYEGNGIGTANPASFITAVRFTAEDLASYYSVYEMGAVKYHVRSENFSEVTVKIWEGGSDMGPGEEIYSADVTDEVLVGSWSTHILPERIHLEPGQEYWMGYSMNATGGGFPLSVDNGPMVQNKGAWLYIDQQWSQLPDINPDLDYNFCIRGILFITEQLDWLSFDPQSGTVEPEDNEDVNLIFNAEELEIGDHHAQVLVQNNTGENIIIPVSLTVVTPRFDVTFEVTGEEGETIDGAIISLGDIINDPGDYFFGDMLAGIYAYEVSKEGYLAASGHVMVAREDVHMEVVLVTEDTEVVSLAVMIDDEFGEAAEGAYFLIQGFGGHLSDGNGQLALTVIPGTYNYSVTKTGFEPLSDEVVITEDAEQHLEVTLTYLRFDIVLDVNIEEAGTVSGGGEYHYGQTATIMAGPNTGFHFLHWLEDGMVVSPDQAYAFEVTKNRDLTGVFAVNIYIIKATAGDNGAINPSGEVEVIHGADVSFDITPIPGHFIEDVMVNEESVGPVEEYTFFAVTEDGQTIHAEFDILTYEVTITYEGNGTVDPEGVVTVDHGEPLVIQLTPDEDHHVSDILVNDESVGAHEEYILTNITSPITFHAIFSFSVDITGIEPYGLLVYPNPATDRVTVRSGEVISGLRLLNLKGQTVRSVRVEGYEHVLDVGGLHPGVYLLEARFRDKKKTVSLTIR